VWSFAARSLAAAQAAVVFATLLVATPVSAYVITTNNDVTTEGWDGPGRNAVTIDWYLGGSSLLNNGLPTGIALPTVEAEIIAAMATWSSYAAITWNYVGNALTNPEIDPFGAWSGGTLVNILWATREHGDLDPFDGASPVGPHLAHAWGPPDVQLTLLEGDMHLDGDEHWVTDTAATYPLIDLQSVILHELGHVLGLGHSFDLSSVMRESYLGPDRTLGVDDMRGIQSLYACNGTLWTGQPCPPPTSSQTGVPTIPLPVPEPGSVTLFAVALAALFGKRRLLG
jgi:hypothetical protein